jgi:alanyl-tRNA synthetase
MEPDDVSMRVIADHSRATAFLVADGVQPSNEGRGYVLRRIMRRAIRHGSRLGYQDLFFHRAAERVIDRMKGVYPELERARELIKKVAESEETAFRRTLDRGIRLLSEEIDRIKGSTKSLDPEFVAKLYHTYGFPIDLTRVIANEQSFTVDEEAAHEAVKRSNPEQADAHLGGQDKAIDKLWFDLRAKHGGTEFLGYEKDQADGKILAIVKGGKSVESASQKDEVSILLDRTPFYGEAGGQVGDRGLLEGAGGSIAVKEATKPLPEITVHQGVVTKGTLQIGDTVSAKIDTAARNSTRKNHSATHILHLALKEVLGSHVQQKGSLVAPDRLRFDYSHFEALTPEQVEAIEKRANEMVLKNADTETKVGSIDDAKKAGAVMLFGEKYGDKVRMVRIGEDTLELCGGTHVRRSGDIGLIKIVGDSAIASGQRRLEAVTGLGALDWVQKQSRILSQVGGALRTHAEAIPERVDKMLKRAKELEKDLERARADAAIGSKSGGDVLDKVEDVNGVKVLVHRADGTPIKALREISDKLRDKLGSGVVILGATEEDKAALLVAVTKDLSGKIKAGDIVKAATQAMGGSGGGRPDFAQGGGKAELLDAGLAKARAAVAGA